MYKCTRDVSIVMYEKLDHFFSVLRVLEQIGEII